MNGGQGGPEENPLLLSNQIDVICDEFEASWLRNERPQIAQFLLDTVASAKSSLFAELVKIDVACRRALGEKPSQADYRATYPDYSEVLAWLDADFEPLNPDAGRSDRQIGSLRLIEEVGSGAFGSVWKAWDSKLERIVAVKLSLESNSPPHSLEQFDREAKSIARLQHPGIVAVYGSGVEENRAFIVLQFIQGETLKELLARKQPTHQQATNFCLKLANAVEHAHRNGVLHRDLKPGNVLIDKNGEPYVTDFGLARRMDATATQTQAGSIVGTLAYMSPEQAEGRPAKFDGRSDIYSLGAILYEMLTGRIPFEGKPREILRSILNVDPTPPKQLDTTIPDDLETICIKCLAKHPRDRYSSAGALAADLRRYLNSAPVHGRRLSTHVRLWRWGQRQPAAIAGIGIAFVAIFAVVVVSIYFRELNRSRVARMMEPRTNSSLIDPFTKPIQWLVHIKTQPEDADVAIAPLDPYSGEPQVDKVLHPYQGPGHTIQLPSGDYLVCAALQSELRFQEVLRHVPGQNELVGIQTNNMYSKVVASGEIEWNVIVIPPANITDGMCLVPGVERFCFGDPENEKQLQYHRIPDFFVATREFTYGDYKKLRERSKSWPPYKPQASQPLDYAMTESYDQACHWAEVAGGRLLTEVEFEFLAVKAFANVHRADPAFSEKELLNTAGLDGSDEIPLVPPIRGFLSCLAEWTSSYAGASDTRYALYNPQQYRIVRGGDNRVAFEEKWVPSWQRNPRERIAAERWPKRSNIGFRVVRSAQPRIR